MVKGSFGRMMLGGGLTLAAALMVSTAVFGQDQDGEYDPAVTYEVTLDDQGIDVGEPDSNGDGGPDIVIDDGAVISILPYDPSDDETDDGGDDGWVDDGSDDGWVDDGSGDDWVDDGSGDDWVDDGSGDDWVDDGSDDDWVDDGSDDGWVDDGSDDGTGNGSGDDVLVDDGEVVIYYLDGGPVRCEDCDFADLPMEVFQMSAGGPAAEGSVADAPVAAKPRRSKRNAVAASGMAECLAEHPQLPWLCEWQNGAGH